MKKPSVSVALIPIIVLVVLIVIGVQIFGDGLTSGPSQIFIIFSGVVAALIAMLRYKVTWDKLEDGIVDNLSKTGGAIYILLMIGALSASWIQSGVVPTMVLLGLDMINPSIFLLFTFVFTGIVSLMAGSSWTTIGTIGVAMLSAGRMLGFDEGWLAGAIISGAYFGDKISPLSDTTNLSASVAGVNLYKHVKYLFVTNIPLFIITAVIFAVAGFFVDTTSTVNLQAQSAQIMAMYNTSPWLLLIPCFTILLIIKKVSPFLTLFLSALLGIVVMCFVQPQVIEQINGSALVGFKDYIGASVKVLSSPVEIATGNEMIDGLVSTSGMFGMLNTIWLILSVVAFGGIMDAAGFVKAITDKMIGAINNATSLVASTVGAGIMCNLVLSDQYMSIVLTGKMFSDIYKKKGYAPELLSRSTEDSATVVSVLIPWNTCAVAQSGVLGVSTLTYLPYCFFNILSPIVTVLFVAFKYKVRRIAKKEEDKDKEIESIEDDLILEV